MRCVGAGFDVTLEDVMPEKLRRAQDSYAEWQGTPARGTLRFASEVEDAVREADLAIDFVPDELESKLEIFCLLDRMAPPHTILLTPIETLSLDDLASCTYRAELCAGVHGGVAGTSATLVRGHATTPSVIAAVQQMMEQAGLQVSVVEDRVDTSLTGRVIKPSIAYRET